MSYHWGPANINNKPVINYDRDVYTPEHSYPTPIVHDKNLPLAPNNKELVTPPLSSANLPKKEQHTIRYAYNELPEKGILLAVQFNNSKKEEEKTKKSIRKAPPDQGTLAPAVETQPSEMNKNYYPQRSLSRKNKSLKDATNNQSSIPRNSNQVVTSGASKHHNKNVNDEFTNEDKRHRHHHHHKPSESQEQNQQQFSVHVEQQPSQHHHHHRHHHHNYSISSAKEYVDQEFRVIDGSFKKSERTTYFQGIGNPPIINNQNSYLPFILPRENLCGSKSTDFYTKYTLSKDWRDSIKSSRICKTDPQTKFYDRYFNSVIEKKITS
ncbi:unnamed protein product [Rotaria socialis]|uniref:Uncharacterized protein n=1 Tax=Rotaria socialis TaxID=392032 RepID=A0A818A5R9_9BILA|nr:unnamed protein product [Rotaria socialis]CAF4892954.1 unnamed protein product [Rotaria socialis]